MALQYRGLDEDFREKLEDLDPKERLIRAPETSYLGLKPGDLIQFRYVTESKNTVYQGLVVSTRSSGSRGYRFARTTYNTILQVLTLDSLSDQLLQFVINNLYKNRILSRYLAIKTRSNTNDQVIDYRYVKNLGRDTSDASEELRESTMSRRLMGRENRAGLVGVLSSGSFKTFKVTGLSDIYSISLLNPDTAQ